MKLATAAEMKELDRQAIEERHIPSIDLMDRAAEGVAQAVLRLLPGRPGKHCRVSVFCGAGNDGGDGIAAARLQCRLRRYSPRRRTRSPGSAFPGGPAAAAIPLQPHPPPPVPSGRWRGCAAPRWPACPVPSSPPPSPASFRYPPASFFLIIKRVVRFFNHFLYFPFPSRRNPDKIRNATET